MDKIIVLDDKAYEALKAVLDYVIARERDDYDENPSESHVYALATLVADAVDGQAE